MIDVTVDGETWYRGHGSSCSLLLDSHGCRCCLGFVGSACGYTDEQLLSNSTPANIATPSANLWPEGWAELTDESDRWLRNAVYVRTMMVINDDTSITDTERCMKLIALGIEHGVRFTFINVHGVIK